ncbi:phage antirepressor KilAC domain-containing protein [Acinetobacter guillouiae]|uniref:phage antirepressor KilAC domain-containing protein n=1 Tax=Acinetobacter guillouiae TaxID=106649 RepID=UPI003AF59953
MNTIVPLQTHSMNSLEIAELVQSEHRAVTLSIERLAKKGVIQLPPMVKVENKQSTSPNRFTNAYEFLGEQGKRDSIIVVAQLCPEFTAHLVDRWKELEQKASQPIFDISNPHHLLHAIEIQSKQNIELSHKVEVLQPKAQALDVLSNSYGTETLDCAAHSMGIQARKTLRPWMKENGWLHKDKDGNWRALGHRITAGHLIEVDRVYTDAQGFPQHTITVYITPKGKTVLTTSLIKAGMIKGDRHETTI